jgi:outer membrane cobalamin receptor
MRMKNAISLMLMLGLSVTVYANDPYDLGQVQVIGKDAQSSKINVTEHMLGFNLDEKSNPMPEMVPLVGAQEYRPITEKQPISTFQKRESGEMSVAAGVGNRNAGEFILHGKGNHEGYNGEGMFKAESRKGFKSNVNSKYIGATGSVTTTTEVGSTFSINGELSKDKFGFRGTSTNPTPDAKLDTSYKGLGFSGSATQDDGAYLKGSFNLNHYDRDVHSGLAGFNKNQKIMSYDFSGTYLRKSEDKFRNKAGFEFKSEELRINGEAKQDFTKLGASFGTDYEISERANTSLGFKVLKSNKRSSTSPYAVANYKLSEPWTLKLSYDEDLKNDSFSRIFMANHYVESNGKKIIASKQRTVRAGVNFRNVNNDTFGAEFFTQTEYDAIEYSDEYNAGSKLTGSVYDFMEAKRTGVNLNSKFKLESHFDFDVRYTFQNPRSETANRRISYEPRRIMDVGVHYKKQKLDIDFSRHVEYDRRAQIYVGAIPTIQSVNDYSRSDIAFKYRANDIYTGYVKIYDLYDEAKRLRYDVLEEGRVFLAGIEAHF